MCGQALRGVRPSVHAGQGDLKVGLGAVASRGMKPGQAQA